jgi:hypothetical protein
LDADAKERILSRNARVVYGIDDATVQRAGRADPDWVTNGAVELQRVLSDLGR